MIDERKFIYPDYISQELRFSKIYQMLDKYWADSIFEVNDQSVNKEVKIDKTIWILWLQGIENAPRLVKQCYKSILKNKPEDYDVVLLDESNLSSYISLPEYIYEKHKCDQISATHFSDILRAGLLYQYGGCWIDSTVYCMDVIPRFMLSGDLFVFKLPGIMTDPVLKLSSWWIYTKKGSRILYAVWKILLDYWKVNDNLADYFLFHIVFSKVVTQDRICSEIFRNVPYYSSGNAHVLYSEFDRLYNPERWDIIKFISPIQKLSYKRKYLQGDIYSNYCHILSNVER